MSIVQRLTKEVATSAPWARPEFLSITDQEAGDLARYMASLAWRKPMHSEAEIKQMILAGDVKWSGVPLKVAA